MSDLTANDSTSAPFTSTADVPQKPDPLTVTDLPTALSFVNDLIAGKGDGSTVNVGPSITPWPVVTRTGPPVVPGAGAAVTRPALSSRLEAAVPPNSTLVTSVSLRPLIETG